MENIQLLQYGKTSQGPFPATREKISKSYSKNLSKSQSQKRPRCLCLKRDGATQTYSWETDGALLTEFLTLNTGEYPSAEKESTLLQILEDNVPEKYYLSAKACEGILRRAERRGKALPPMLKEALEQQIARTERWVYDCQGNGDGKTAPTITGDHNNRVTDYTACIVEPETYCLQGSMIGRQDKNGPQGDGVNENISFTLNATDRHGVAYAMQGFGDYKQSDIASGIKARDYKDATDLIVEIGAKPKYIVRRLTPTECARLQSFPDRWGHPDKKAEFTDAEYLFWMDVRNTHAAINGKTVKEYTKAQMLTWYTKLHTDSAEYKMWGNGIALPTALYVMQGIAKELKGSDK